jgi:hypothetical protein
MVLLPPPPLCNALLLLHCCVVRQVVSPGPAQQPGVPSTLTACSIDSYNYAVVLMNWRQAVFTDNVVARSIRSAFDVDSTSFGVQLVRNMVASVQPPPDAPTDWVRPMAAFYLDVQPAALTNNLAAGVADSGFVLRVRLPCHGVCCTVLVLLFRSHVPITVLFPLSLCHLQVPSCSDPAATNGVLFGNEAHSVLVGVFMLPRSGCAKLAHWSVWKASHIGVLALDMLADVHLDAMFISDSHIGVWWVTVGGSNRARLTSVSQKPKMRGLLFCRHDVDAVVLHVWCVSRIQACP